DRTVMIPVPLSPGPGAATRAPAPVPSAAVPVEPVSSEPLAMPAAPLRARRSTPATWGIPLVVLLLALAWWAVGRRRAPAASDTAAADTGALAALHDKFLRLEGEVAVPPADAPEPEEEAAPPPPPDTATPV